MFFVIQLVFTVPRAQILQDDQSVTVGVREAVTTANHFLFVLDTCFGIFQAALDPQIQQMLEPGWWNLFGGVGGGREPLTIE